MSSRTEGTKRRRPASGSRGTGRSSARRRAPKNNNFNNILIIVLSIIVVISCIGGAIKSASNPKGSKDSDSKVKVEQGDSDSSLSVEENDNSLQRDSYPEINKLVSNYRKAILEGDVELLKEVYDTDQDINEDILTGTSQIIEAYNNTQCYSKRGRNVGEYVVFVYDDIQISGIKTAAPNLSVFYMKTNEKGKLYIYRGDYSTTAGTFTYDADTQAYLQSIYEDSDVAELISNVNTLMNSACANDNDLMEFMQKMRSKSSTVTSDISDSTAETTESQIETETTETELETEPAETEPAETEASGEEEA